MKENFLGHGEKNMIFERGGGNIEIWKIYTPVITKKAVQKARCPYNF